MTMKINRTWKIVSFMLQGIILAALFLSPAISLANAKSNSAQISVRAGVSTEAILDVEEEYLPESGSDKLQFANTFQPDILADEPALEVSTTDALAVGISLRNVFYTFITSKAP